MANTMKLNQVELKLMVGQFLTDNREYSSVKELTDDTEEFIQYLLKPVDVPEEAQVKDLPDNVTRIN